MNDWPSAVPSHGMPAWCVMHETCRFVHVGCGCGWGYCVCDCDCGCDLPRPTPSSNRAGCVDMSEPKEDDKLEGMMKGGENGDGDGDDAGWRDDDAILAVASGGGAC